MSSIKNYLSLIKFSHTIFAMPFAMIGFFLGVFKGSPFLNKWSLNFFQNENMNTNGGWHVVILPPSYLIYLFILVVLCMIFARSAAMAFNRWLDAQYDKKNPRTAIREIPSGIIKPKDALIFTVINAVLFITVTFFINRACFYLSPIALLVILGYSFTKRFTALCHLILGIGLALAPIGSYIAVTGVFDILPVLFSFTVLCWVSGFDIIYALQDETFDKENNLNSIPAALGKTKALRTSELLHLMSAAFVIYAGIYGNFGWWYWTGVVIFIALLIYQHTLVKPTDLSKVNMAFFTTNGIASVLFSIFVLLEIFLNR